MIDLLDHKNWDRSNGTLSVSLNPKHQDIDSSLYVVLNGNIGNFCLDYTRDVFDKSIAKQRAWSSDTGFYVKLDSGNVLISRWWDDATETIPYSTVQESPKKFYNALVKLTPQLPGGVVSFSKEAFIKLRNCIMLSDNGQVSLRVFMYLLAALADNVGTPTNVDRRKWHLGEFDSSWINMYDWEWLYERFQKGTNKIPPLINLVLRHASNRLFQEAHREATRKDFQSALWGGSDRLYNSGIADGAFYTPTSLVRTIVQESIFSLNKAIPLSERQNLRILDPACGSAEFLREVLRQLKMNNYNGKIQLIGWDISEIACEMSNFVLHYENISEWEGNVEINIIKRDSLTYDWSLEKAFDIILMNPPFRSFENLGSQKVIVSNQLGGLISRQPDLSAVFLKKASESLSEAGALGLILPHSLLVAETYTKLRSYIKDTLGMNFSLLARLGSSGLFEKAMIIPAVLVGSKAKRIQSHTVLWTDHQQTSVYTALRELRIYRYNDIPTPITNNCFSIYENAEITKKDQWSIKSFQLSQLAEKLKDFDTVGKLYKISRGVDTGCNAAFVLTKEQWKSLPQNEQPYFRPGVMRESIVNGQLRDNYYIFYPYGEFEIASEDILKSALPVYFRELEKYNEKLKIRRGKSEKWWELNEYRPWQIIPEPKLISAYFGKAGYFAFDKGGEFLVGQSFAWLPKKVEMKQECYYFSYLALLHAPLMDRLFEMTCNILDGGFFDFSKHYIDKLPLPDLTKADSIVINKLSQIGEEIHLGKMVDHSSLNQTAANVYGLNLESLLLDY